MITLTNNTISGPNYEAITKAVQDNNHSKIIELLKGFFSSFTIEQEKKVLGILNERHEGFSFVHRTVVGSPQSKEFIQLLLSWGANFFLLQTDSQGKEIRFSSAFDYISCTPKYSWNFSLMKDKALLLYIQTTIDKISSVNKEYRDTINISRLINEYYFEEADNI